MSPRSRGILLVGGAATCWASESLMVRLIEAAGDWQILFWSGAVMTCAMAAWLYYDHRGRLFRALLDTGRPGLIAAVSVAAAYSGFIFALNRTTVANTVVLLGTAPLFAALLARVVLGERVRRRTWAAMGLALAGVALMVSDSLTLGRLSGDLFALGTGALYGVGIVALRAAPVRNGAKVDMMPANAAAGILIAIIAATRDAPFAVSERDLVLLLAIGLIPAALGSWLFTRGVRHLQAAEAGLLCLLEAVIAPLLVWAVLSETPTAQALAGAAIVLAALVYETLPERRALAIGERTVEDPAAGD